MLLHIITIIIITYFLIELNHHLRIKSPLILSAKEFEKSIVDSKQKYSALVEIYNMHKTMEVMIPFFKVTPQLIGIAKDQITSINTTIKPHHPDEEAQESDYWHAYILKSEKSTFVKIEVEYEIKLSAINSIKCLWLDIEWGNYGPFGFFTRFDGFVLPNYLDTAKNTPSNKKFIEPIKTHILGSLDNPINILKSYIPQDYTPQDILTIGESPLAIMQGQYIDYRSINVSPVAKILCKGFHPTSSLATACGLQTLINISGPTRVITAWFVGGICKLLGIKGLFYRLAGEQARLIDDITGTTPPYDKSIVLGPKDALSFCIQASKELNIDVAIVDVNDLGRVKILSTNNINNSKIIKRALMTNPAGNANQLTPLVLIRNNEPISRSQES